jgi:hypothetical protein
MTGRTDDEIRRPGLDVEEVLDEFASTLGAAVPDSDWGDALMARCVADLSTRSDPVVSLLAHAERVTAERDALAAEVERLREESGGNAAGLAYWNRRYVETERQAAVDVAARDALVEYAHGLAAAIAAVVTVPLQPDFVPPDVRQNSYSRGWTDAILAVRAALAADRSGADDAAVSHG